MVYWDNLIVLDACRVDLFEATLDWEIFDSYRVVESMGSATPQWISRNFTDSSGDRVYISGNNFVSELAANRFHDLGEVNAVMDDCNVVHPKSIYEIALEKMEMYSNKRFIIHFI